MSSVHVLYGVVMQEATASGDLERMKAVAAEAKEHLSKHGDVAAAYEALKLEIARAEAQSIGGPLPPYGVAIQQAVASGDLDRMREVAAQAEHHIAEHGNVPVALELLRAEIRKHES